MHKFPKAKATPSVWISLALVSQGCFQTDNYSQDHLQEKYSGKQFQGKPLSICRWGFLSLAVVCFHSSAPRMRWTSMRRLQKARAVSGSEGLRNESSPSHLQPVPVFLLLQCFCRSRYPVFGNPVFARPLHWWWMPADGPCRILLRSLVLPEDWLCRFSENRNQHCSGWQKYYLYRSGCRSLQARI